MGWEGIGTLIGKLTDWVPNRKEYRRNKIDEIKRKMAELHAKVPFTKSASFKYAKYATKLRKLERDATND